MPQWQFKLFEFDSLDRYPHDKENSDYTPGKDNKKFIVQMFGIDTEGKTASIFVKGFDPFFYVKVGDDWTDSDMMELVNYIKHKMGSYYEESLIKPKLIKRHKLYGFDNKKLHTFVRLKFKNMRALNKAKNLWYKDTMINGVFNRKLIVGGIEFKEIMIELYESNIPPLLRLFHIQEISPSGWIALQNNRFTQHTKLTTTCDYEFSVKYSDIVSLHKRETNVPYKILSVDIEASSSHGDFPLPKKNYKKLATNIVDIIRTNEPTEELLKSCVMTAFELDNLKNVDKVYTKKPYIDSDIEHLFNEWIKLCPAKYSKMKADEELTNELLNENEKDEEENDDNDDDNDDSNREEAQVQNFGFKFGKKSAKKYTKKEATILEMLLDSTAERDTKIQGLNDTLTVIFPELEGDQVTFIGSSLRRNGEVKPYLKHCIVVGDCDQISGVEIESYKTEKEALIAWTAFMQRENPDIVIGYNVHGWDYGFMYERSKELNCVKQFLRLSRNKNEICLKKDWKTGKENIEENSLYIASGQYDIKYYNMTGRLQIDFLNLFRREEQLPSYKLDYVAGHFIGDDIKSITYDEYSNTSLVLSKNLIGLEEGDYIVIEEIGHTTDMYEGGKKLQIKNLKEGSFEIDGEILPDKTKKLRWCLGKDDVTPQDIFKLTNEGPSGRAIVGKYCIKDTTLIHDLMRKVDTMTGYVEMSKLCSVPINFLVMRGQGIKLQSFVAKKCREKNTLMPVIEKSLDDEGYEGATVLNPKTGLYLDTPVACVDYSSLYPSSIISENLSHDSKVWSKEYDLEGNLLKECGEKDEDGNYIYDNLEEYKYVDVTYDTFKWIRKTPKAAKTKELAGYKICRFAQFPDGSKAILPAILEELLGARKATKKQMKNEKDPFMENVLDKRQLSIKITANSLYGQTGAQTSSFYEKDVAASTTATGRNLLMYAKKTIEDNYGDAIVETKDYGKVKTKATTVYGDTDSVFFAFNLLDMEDKPITGKKALIITIELAQEVSRIAKKGLKSPHDLEYEKTFLPFCLLSKKRYVGMLYEFDPEKCKRKSMGIVLKRRDNAPIVKDIYGGVIDILMKEQVVHKAVEFVKDSLQNVIEEKYPREKLVITKSLRSYYKNPMQIAHNVLAIRMGERDSGNKPGPGDRIPFAYIKVDNKKALQGEKIEHPKYIAEKNLQLDYGFYITNQIMKPLQQLFALVLEEMSDFRSKRGRQEYNNPHGTWKKDIDKLKEKWTDEEKFNKKYEEFRCKEVKTILFDPFIKMVK